MRERERELSVKVDVQESCYRGLEDVEALFLEQIVVNRTYFWHRARDPLEAGELFCTGFI